MSFTITDKEREWYVQNYFELYKWWKREGGSLKDFTKKNKEHIDAKIKQAVKEEYMATKKGEWRMHKNYIQGGKGDKVPFSNLNQGQLKKGVKVEREHTSNKRIAKEIAGDHLSEQMQSGEKQDYYTRLHKMEAGFVKVKNKRKSKPKSHNSLFRFNSKLFK